jgi:hypothetical protein
LDLIPSDQAESMNCLRFAIGMLSFFREVGVSFVDQLFLGQSAVRLHPFHAPPRALPDAYGHS